MSAPSQTSSCVLGSRLQGFLLLSGLPGGIGTRFQWFKSFPARRSIQPVGSFCRALESSCGSAAGAGMRAAMAPIDTAMIHNSLIDMAGYSLYHHGRLVRWLRWTTHVG